MTHESLENSHIADQETTSNYKQSQPIGDLKGDVSDTKYCMLQKHCMF